jgi:hypothetical protein
MEPNIGLLKTNGAIGGVKMVHTSFSLKLPLSFSSLTHSIIYSLNRMKRCWIVCILTHLFLFGCVYMYILGYFRIRRGTNEVGLEDNIVVAMPNLNSVTPEYEEVNVIARNRKS